MALSRAKEGSDAHILCGVGRPLAVGIQLPEAEREVPWPEYVAMARAAERVGFDSVWVGDHLLYRDQGEPERGPWDLGRCWRAWPR